MAIQNNDFIELDYTGKLADGLVFDTTEKSVAKENGLPTENLQPATICVGEKQILPGLDEQLVGKDVGARITVTLPPGKAFGKRDIKNMRIMPMDNFRQHKMDPRPGLTIDVDGRQGVVTRVASGRVIVNFNHPLAGKEVTYNLNILRKITDQKEQMLVFLNSGLKIPKDQISIEITAGKAEVTLPLELPEPFAGPLAKKMKELVKVDVEFKSKKE